jgi:hypothetical protein
MGAIALATAMSEQILGLSRLC